MEKRLTTTAMLFSVGFVFMLVIAVAAFFYGIQLGTDKTEARYQAEANAASGAAVSSTPYQQQDLVSFYHNVFLPYREFQNEWFNAVTKLNKGKTNDATATFKELSELAEAKSKEAGNVNLQTSPLLAEAQISYIRSLKLFHEAAQKVATSAKTIGGNELVTQIDKEKSYQSATQFSLSAQQAYYSAMLKWAAAVNLDIPADYKSPTMLELNKWLELPLVVKNKLMAEQLASRMKLTAYYPQDLTSRVDDFVMSGQSAKMKLHTLSAVVDLLINTEAVRSGDFIANKERLYKQALLPLLPFFEPVTE
jgi:hypothetical protein